MVFRTHGIHVEYSLFKGEIKLAYIHLFSRSKGPELGRSGLKMDVA